MRFVSVQMADTRAMILWVKNGKKPIIFDNAGL